MTQDQTAATAARLDRTAEFDRQIENLMQKGYAQAAGVAAADFRKHVDPLRKRVAELEEGFETERVPFVVVIKGDLVAADRQIQLVERRGETGFSMLDPSDIGRFEPSAGIRLPSAPAYLLVDVDTGRDSLNVAPEDAQETIAGRGRSPLTIDEGIALITHHPEAVATNGGFSLLGSRSGDRRVTALWISRGRPKLGWCWAGNPHTWLGSASCAGRKGPDP